MRRNTAFNGAEQEGVGLFQVTQKNGERWSATKGFFTPVLQRPNLPCYPRRVTRITACEA